MLSSTMSILEACKLRVGNGQFEEFSNALESSQKISRPGIKEHDAVGDADRWVEKGIVVFFATHLHTVVLNPGFDYLTK